MKSKELCEFLDISYKALRVYEEEGLIKPNRDNNNYCLLYTSDAADE